ncbi:hypothetical protein FRB97_007196 [Tulasnella sp. 331]|nr:hypothetical protein FRB97_007196 [Tulasnella sp. 331]
MEDETADIQLLDQYLQKTSVISQRMTTILKKFDTRLKTLEKSILPLHTSTEKLTRLADNIDSTLRTIGNVASQQEDTTAEEALIVRGPRAADLGAYIAALERLNTSLAFGSAKSNTGKTAQLVETGAKKLSQLYTKLVAEASSGNAIIPESYLPSPPNPFPTISRETLKQLKPVVSALRSLPLPATHPSHPAAPAILATLREAQAGYAEMRGNWAKRCMEPGSRRVLGQLETQNDGGGLPVGQDAGQWVEAMLALAEAENETLLQLALLPGMTTLIQQSFGSLCAPLFSMFSLTISAIQAAVKKSLLTHVWLALQLWASLTALQPVWDEVMRKRTGRKENELSEIVHAVRGVCLRSFPEFIMEIKLAASPAPSARQVELGTGTADVTKMAVDYIYQIPDIQSTVASALRTLGDGNWNMGGGAVVNKKEKDHEADDRELLDHYIHDVITTLTSTLTALAKTQRRPALASIFVLNNIAYVRARLLEAPTTAGIDEIMSTTTQSHLNSQYRTAKADYFSTNFTVLLTSLGETKGGMSKSETKEKFGLFFDQLEEAAERHRFARVLGDDPHGREGLADDVVRLVIPALTTFLQKYKDKDFSKNIKATPEEVEKTIRNFYT